MANSFFRFFPLPKLLKLPTIGIDISTNHVRFVEIKDRGDDRFCLGRYGTKVLSLPIKWNSENRERALIDTLKEIGTENNFENVNVSLPEEQAFFFNVKLDLDQKNNIRESIEFKLEEYIPYNPSEVVFDYRIIEQSISNGGYILANVGVAPKNTIDQYVEIFKQAGLRPIVFEIEAQAAARAVVPMADDKDFSMIINIGSDNTILSIVNLENIWLTDTINIGGEIFNKSIAENLSINIEKAESLKWEVGLKSNLSQGDEVKDAMITSISSIRDEVGRYYKYWQTHKLENETSGRRIKKIFLCGSQASINGLADYLSASLGLDVVLSNPWINFLSFDECIPDLHYSKSLGYATAIGSAAAGIHKICGCGY